MARRRLTSATMGMAVAVLLVACQPVKSPPSESPPPNNPETPAFGGTFTSHSVTGPACPSPFNFCTAGNLSGSLEGPFTFVASNVIPTGDTPTTGVVIITGDLTLQTAGGQLICKDALALQTAGSGPLASLCTVVGGTGAFSGATGFLQFVGTFTDAGGGSGTYQGELVV